MSKIKQSLLLFKEYCVTFNLRPTINKDELEKWKSFTDCGLIAIAFIKSEIDKPPIMWIDGKGDIWICQDEAYLNVDEPATAVINDVAVQTSINIKRPIHDPATI